jgi:hypothetical protein
MRVSQHVKPDRRLDPGALASLREWSCLLRRFPRFAVVAKEHEFTPSLRGHQLLE